LLQLRQGRAVGAGDLLRERRLEDGQGLAELHGAALELPEHLEQLVGGALLPCGTAPPTTLAPSLSRAQPPPWRCVLPYLSPRPRTDMRNVARPAARA